MEKKYLALAFYVFTPIADPEKEVRGLKNFFNNLEVAGRIYVSEEGINGQMSGKKEAAFAFIDWFKSDARFSNVSFKSHEVDENIFPRMTVKTRKELVAVGEKVNVAEGGEHISPEAWHEMLEKEKDAFILDVRNDYEWKIGHFAQAHLPPLESFRDFPKYADKLKSELDPKTKVMMYCTGGIRCEIYSAILKKRGFKNVYQLDGGIINYGQKVGDAYWRGKLFVFDDRMAIPIDGKSAQPIAKCQFCEQPTDLYYNCANMDCNALFITCPQCIEEQKGACSQACLESPRLRPYDARSGNKPFRRKHTLNCHCSCD